MALLTNLISYWKFDEASGNAEDIHGTNDLTNNGTITYGAGKINNGADLERGSTQSFSVGDNASLSLTGDFTFSLWVKPESAPGVSDIFGLIAKRSTGLGSLSYRLAYQESTGLKISLSISSDGSAETDKTWAVDLGTGTWKHLVVTYDASAGSAELFVNNSSVGTVTGLPTSIYDGGANFVIGNNVSDGGAANYFDGMIDEMGVWSEVLIGEDITALYNSGNGLSYGDLVATGTTQVIII